MNAAMLLEHKQLIATIITRQSAPTYQDVFLFPDCLMKHFTSEILLSEEAL